MRNRYPLHESTLAEMMKESPASVGLKGFICSPRVGRYGGSETLPARFNKHLRYNRNLCRLDQSHSVTKSRQFAEESDRSHPAQRVHYYYQYQYRYTAFNC